MTNPRDAKLATLGSNESGKQETRKRNSDRMNRIYKIEIRISSLPAFLIDFSEPMNSAPPTLI
jgi:hypothetical protein